MKLGMQLGLGPGHNVLDEDLAPLSQKGAEPLPYVYCGQTAGWMKMALGMEVGHCSGHIVLDGDQAPLPKKMTEPPIFGPCMSIVVKCLYVSGCHLVRR